MAIQQTSLEIEWHSLLKKSAIQQSRLLGRDFLKWAFETRPILRVTAYVIEGLESAMNFGIKIGMRREGFRRDVCVQDGTVKGVHILGITRKDWSET